MGNPRFKLTIGGKGRKMTSADMKWGCGRIRLEVNDAYPDAAAVLSRLFDLHWGKALLNMRAFMDAHPYDWTLTESAGASFETELAEVMK